MSREPTSSRAESRAPAETRRWPYAPTEPGRAFTAPESLACLLPPPEIADRVRELRESFVPGVLEIEELEDGYVYWFERTDEWFSIVTEFALFESRCCDFLDFEVGLQAAGARISLRVAGPGKGKEFLAQAHLGQIPSKRPTG